jgi:hypothetical protein
MATVEVFDPASTREGVEVEPSPISYKLIGLGKTYTHALLVTVFSMTYIKVRGKKPPRRIWSMEDSST